MSDRGFQPIKVFSRIDISKIIYLSQNFLTQTELEIVLDLISIADRNNIIETGSSLNQYIQNQFKLHKVQASKHIKKIRDLRIILPFQNNSHAFRLMQFIANRQRIIYNLHEFDSAETVFNMANEAGENRYRIWLGEAEDFKKKHSPSYSRIHKLTGATEPVITVKEHEMRMADAKNKFDEEMKLLRSSFREVIDEMKSEGKQRQEELQEMKAESRRLAKQHDEILGLLKNIAAKVDLPSEEQEEVKRHLSLVRSDEK